VNMQPIEAKHDLTIRELDILKERIMPLMPGKEVEWVTITQDITKPLTLKNKKATLQAMCNKLENHVEALAKVKILLVQAAQRPDQYTDPLGKFYEWLVGRYKYTARQQLIKFNLLLKNMNWSWETNPVDQILAMMHEVHLTWDDVVSNKAVRDDFKATLARKMKPSMYMILCERPTREWCEEITKIWKILKINEPIGKDRKAHLTSTNNKGTSDASISKDKGLKYALNAVKGVI